MLFYYHCRIVNGVEDITDFFICIIIIDRVYTLRSISPLQYQLITPEKHNLPKIRISFNLGYYLPVYWHKKYFSFKSSKLQNIKVNLHANNIDSNNFAT